MMSGPARQAASCLVVVLLCLPRSVGADIAVAQQGAPDKMARTATSALRTEPAPATSRQALRIGDAIEPSAIHLITRPGLYGIGNPPRGSRYGVAEGRLIRFDPQTMQLQSVIRAVDRILD